MPDKQQITEDIDVRLVQTPSDFEGAKKLRFKVFVEEQGVPFKEETDQFDIVASHAVAVKSWQIVGTGRMFVDPSGEAKIGRMAVQSELRGSGIGSRILNVLEQHARETGCESVTVNAQSYVAEFYGNHGYIAQGEPFMEVGIEHLRMTKALNS